MHQIGVVGLSYRHAGVDQVARFAVPRTEVPARLPALRTLLKAAEILYVGTCNRVEVVRSEEHTSELQSQSNLVCRLLLEKKNRQNEMLDYQQKESTPRVSSIMENTNLSKQQQVSEIIRQMLTQAQTAGQYFTNEQIKEMTRKVSAEVDLVHQQTQNQRYGSSNIVVFFFFLIKGPPPNSPLFPYTTLFI